MDRRLLLLGALVLLALVLFLAERHRPLRRPTHELWARLVLNLVVSALTFAIAAILLRPLVEHLTLWTVDAPFGLVQVVPLPEPLRVWPPASC